MCDCTLFDNIAIICYYRDIAWFSSNSNCEDVAINCTLEVVMDKARMGEIALLVLRMRYREEGVRLSPNFKREIGNIARNINVPIEEVFEFAEIIVRDLVEEMFSTKKQSVQGGEKGHDDIGSDRVWREIDEGRN